MREDASPQHLLRRIVASPSFRDSGQHASLLEYLCYQTQTGNPDTLHEHDIGVELFGLEPGYDVAENPLVSRLTEEIRDRLRLFFTSEGRTEPIRLVIPKGEFRAFFYEADPAQIAAAEVEPTGLDAFWAPHWQSPTPTLLFHGVLPGDTMPIAEAYAAAMVAMLFHKQDQRLELLPCSAVEETSLARRNLVVIGTAATNPLVAMLQSATPQTAIAERIAPTPEHGWVTLLTAPDVDGILDAARYVITPQSLDHTLQQYGEAGFPPFFRLNITPA